MGPRRRTVDPTQDGRFIDFDTGMADFGGVHFDADEFSDLVVDHGVGAELRRSQVCPCVREETLGARASCPLCAGLRWIHPESGREPVTVLLGSQQLQRAALQGGTLLTGTVQVTFPVGIVPGEGDLLLPDGEVHVVHETLWRAAQPVAAARMRSRVTASDQVPQQPSQRRERLLYPDVTEIEAVWFWDDEGSQPLQAFENADWLHQGGRIVWLGDRGPAAGQAYTVRYHAPAAYLLFPGEPVYRQEAGTTMPYKAIANRLDRWGTPSLRDSR